MRRAASYTSAPSGQQKLGLMSGIAGASDVQESPKMQKSGESTFMCTCVHVYKNGRVRVYVSSRICHVRVRVRICDMVYVLVHCMRVRAHLFIMSVELSTS